MLCDIGTSMRNTHGNVRQPPRTGSTKPPAATKDRTSSPHPSQPAAKHQKTEHASTPAVPTTQGAPTHGGKEGKDFPQIRTSKLDLNANPTWPGANKPLTFLDIDADLAENSKPWRLPGTDQTDFFNYGFDEYTWVQYCLKQQDMAGKIKDQKDQDAKMKDMFGGGGGPGGMPSMPGMPDMNMMAMMSGMDPSQMASMFGAPPGMGGPGMGGTPQPGAGFGQQGGASPHPQGQQGFQPPTGPSGGSGQGGFNMDGYSQQQMAIMQEQQGQMGGGGGGRGRGRRGRGFY